MNKCFSDSVIILLSNRPLMRRKRPVYAGSQISLLIQTQSLPVVSPCNRKVPY